MAYARAFMLGVVCAVALSRQEARKLFDAEADSLLETAPKEAIQADAFGAAPPQGAASRGKAHAHVVMLTEIVSQELLAIREMIPQNLTALRKMTPHNVTAFRAMYPRAANTLFGVVPHEVAQLNTVHHITPAMRHLSIEPTGATISASTAIWSIITWTILVVLVAYFWKGSRPEIGVEPEKRDEIQREAMRQNEMRQNETRQSEHVMFNAFQEWKFGLFSCFDDIGMCACACCCPAIRWAETMSLAPGMLMFWASVFLWLALHDWLPLVSMSLGQGIGVIQVFWLAVMTFCRQRLRVKFEMEAGTPRTWIFDCLQWCCCIPCTIMQEARQVENAIRFGHPRFTEYAGNSG